MIRIIAILALSALVPSATAQVDAWAEVPWDLDAVHAKITEGGQQRTTSGDLACRGGSVLAQEGDPPGFRFFEGPREAGCGLLAFHGPVPAQATRVQVSFLADRQVRQEVFPFGADPEFFQELWVGPGVTEKGLDAITAEGLVRLPYHGNADGRRDPFPFTFQADLHGESEVMLAWYWHETGGTAEARQPTPLVQAGGTVEDMEAVFTVPLAQEADIEALTVTVPAEVLHAGGTLHVRFAGEGPQTVRTTGLTLREQALASDATGKGVHYVATLVADPDADGPATVEFRSSPTSAQSLSGGLPWWAASLMFPFLAGVGATASHVAMARRSHGLGERPRHRPGIAALVTAAGLVIAAALYAGGLLSMRLAPGSPTSLALHLMLGVFSVALVVVAGMHLDERRRVKERAQARQAEAYAARLEQSNRDLEQFAYVASHDLQAPLRQVIGFAELALRDAGEDLGPRSRQFLEHAASSAAHMRTLIEDLLTFSRVGIDEPVRKTVAVSTIVERVRRDLGSALDGAEISVHGGALLWGNPSQLEQLLSNLIENASKYRAADRPCRIEVRSGSRGNETVLEVEDNGLGIPADARERIFEVFQRLHGEDIAGTGIGLAICKRIAQAHGGRIEVASEPGEGTTMRVYLPRRPA